MKRILLGLAAGICFLLTVTACSRESGYTFLAVGQDTPHSISKSYQKFSGYREQDLSVPSDKTMLLAGEFSTDSGRLDITVTDAKENVIFEQKDVQNSDFETKLAEGNYTLRIDADDHSGSYFVSWSLNQKET